MCEQHAGGQHRGIRTGARARYAGKHLVSIPCRELSCLQENLWCFPWPGHLTAPLSLAEKLKFTPPPQPLQCMEFNKEVTVSCSATGREKPTIQWTKTGEGDLDGICLSFIWIPGASQNG